MLARKKNGKWECYNMETEVKRREALNLNKFSSPLSFTNITHYFQFLKKPKRTTKTKPNNNKKKTTTTKTKQKPKPKNPTKIHKKLNTKLLAPLWTLKLPKHYICFNNQYNYLQEQLLLLFPSKILHIWGGKKKPNPKKPKNKQNPKTNLSVFSNTTFGWQNWPIKLPVHTVF